MESRKLCSGIDGGHSNSIIVGSVLAIEIVAQECLTFTMKAVEYTPPASCFKDISFDIQMMGMQDYTPNLVYEMRYTIITNKIITRK